MSDPDVEVTDIEASELEEVTESITPAVALTPVEENPAPDISPASEGKQPPRPRRIAPPPEN
jgi:hypothetical protein